MHACMHCETVSWWGVRRCWKRTVHVERKNAPCSHIWKEVHVSCRSLEVALRIFKRRGFHAQVTRVGMYERRRRTVWLCYVERGTSEVIAFTYGTADCIKGFLGVRDFISFPSDLVVLLSWMWFGFAMSNVDSKFLKRLVDTVRLSYLCGIWKAGGAWGVEHVHGVCLWGKIWEKTGFTFNTARIFLESFLISSFSWLSSTLEKTCIRLFGGLSVTWEFSVMLIYRYNLTILHPRLALQTVNASNILARAGSPLFFFKHGYRIECAERLCCIRWARVSESIIELRLSDHLAWLQKGWIAETLSASLVALSLLNVRLGVMRCWWNLTRAVFHVLIVLAVLFRGILRKLGGSYDADLRSCWEGWTFFVA